MAADLTLPQANLSPSEALHTSQQAPYLLRKLSPWAFPWPLSLLLNADSPENWTVYENLFYACLRTGDDRSANVCLNRMKDRFGPTNERVMGLMGLYHEALAPNDEVLERYLKEYEEAIDAKPTNMVVRKRRVALLKSMSRLSEATAALVEVLEISPTDAEAWSELAELYFAQAMYPQAIYSLEEVLLCMPNAWNMHARLAEVLYVAATAASSAEASNLKLLTRSLKTFCRSIELCDDYLRGYYGLKLTTKELEQGLSKTGNSAISNRDSTEDDFPLPTLPTVQRLNELATSKLAEIIRRHSTGDKGWDGYEEAEIIAARELLDRDSSRVVR